MITGPFYTQRRLHISPAKIVRYWYNLSGMPHAAAATRPWTYLVTDMVTHDHQTWRLCSAICPFVCDLKPSLKF